MLLELISDLNKTIYIAARLPLNAIDYFYIVNIKLESSADISFSFPIFYVRVM